MPYDMFHAQIFHFTFMIKVPQKNYDLYHGNLFKIFRRHAHDHWSRKL